MIQGTGRLPHEAATASIERLGLLSKRVVLSVPSDPVAWAVGAMDADAFVVHWHAERKLGVRGKGFVMQSPAIEVPGPITVRAYSDDGRVWQSTFEAG
jgi:hypothetical protein